MKKNEKAARTLTLSRETLRNLESSSLGAVVGGDLHQDVVLSVKFCTTTCTTTTGGI